MQVKLLGMNEVLDSPERSVYSLKRNEGRDSFTLIAPIDVWLLERNSDSDFGKLRSPSVAWSEAELALPQDSKGSARLVGDQPSLMTNGFSPVVKGVTNSGFRVREDSQEHLAEKVSRLDIFPRSEVKPGLKVAIPQAKGVASPRGEVSSVDETFMYKFLSPLALTVPRLNVLKVRVRNRLNARMIGAPVIARRPEEPPKRLGMLVGFDNQPSGSSNAFVLPSEILE